jgi:hypothetical protein
LGLRKGGGVKENTPNTRQNIRACFLFLVLFSHILSSHVKSNIIIFFNFFLNPQLVWLLCCCIAVWLWCLVQIICCCFSCWRAALFFFSFVYTPPFGFGTLKLFSTLKPHTLPNHLLLSLDGGGGGGGGVRKQYVLLLTTRVFRRLDRHGG